LGKTPNEEDGCSRRSTEPSLKYNKYYIGLAKYGLPDNFVTMRPRKPHLLASFRIPRSEELTARLEDQGFETMPYDTRWNNYRLRLTEKDFIERLDELRQLVKEASGPSSED